MKKELLCVLFIGAHTELFEQRFKNYLPSFKKLPLLPTAQTTNRDHKAIHFEQKVGFKKKKFEYTLALRY